MDRGKTPWITVYTHNPLYNSNDVHQHELATSRMKLAMEPLFKAHRVAVVFAGHVHAYERTHPVFKGSLDVDAPAYITIGDGGNREGL